MPIRKIWYAILCGSWLLFNALMHCKKKQKAAIKYQWALKDSTNKFSELLKIIYLPSKLKN
jgi:hypothetical protein